MSLKGPQEIWYNKIELYNICQGAASAISHHKAKTLGRPSYLYDGIPILVRHHLIFMMGIPILVRPFGSSLYWKDSTISHIQHAMVCQLYQYYCLLITWSLMSRGHQQSWYWYRLPWYQGSWGQHGAHLGPTGPRWVPCWSHELCHLGM